MPAVKAALADADGHAVRDALARDGVFTLDIDGTSIALGPDDLEVRAQQHEELALAQEGGLAVALDLVLDDELRAEGAARELVRAVNDERKAQGLAISDRIALVVCAAADVLAAVDAHRDTVAGEVLATEVEVCTGESTTMARAVTTSIGSIGFSVEAR